MGVWREAGCDGLVGGILAFMPHVEGFSPALEDVKRSTGKGTEERAGGSLLFHHYSQSKLDSGGPWPSDSGSQGLPRALKSLLQERCLYLLPSSPLASIYPFIHPFLI